MMRRLVALFACLPYPFKIMAKRGLFYVHFMGWHLGLSGNFPVDRGDARTTARSLRRVIDGVRSGTSLAVFPEGTRTPDGHLQEFKPGAFKIALHAGAPVVPVAIRGTFALLPKTTLAPRPGPVDVCIRAPIDVSAYNEAWVTDLVARTRAAIESTLGAPAA